MASRTSADLANSAQTSSTMEDLIASISGNMHVGQEGYDLKALQVSLGYQWSPSFCLSAPSRMVHSAFLRVSSSPQACCFAQSRTH